MDATLIVGGTPVLQIPNRDGTRLFTAPRAKRIAYEFRSGSYKLGWHINFDLNKYQEAEVRNADPKVGEYLLVHAVPAEHVINSVLLKVSKGDVLAKGAQLKPVILTEDSKGKLTETEILKDANTMALDTPSVQWVELEQRHFVEPNTTAIFAYKVVALPTDEKVKLWETQSIFSACLEVDGFDIPDQM